MNRNEIMLRRASRVRYKLRQGDPERLRLSFFKSRKHISVQLIDDSLARTLVSVSTVGKEFASLATSHGIGYNKSNKKVASLLAKMLCERVNSIGMMDKKIVFDRGSFSYTGVIKEFADTVREGGLLF